MARITDTFDGKPTAIRVREQFRYLPDSGHLIRTSTGKRAGSINRSGHRQVRFEGVLFMEHRISWLLVHGDWPKGEIDHINGVPGDNRMENLRECSHAQNMKNCGIRSVNKTGVTGVSLYTPRGDYVAYITVDGKRKHLGYFPTIEEAAKARKTAEIDMYKEFRRMGDKE